MNQSFSALQAIVRTLLRALADAITASDPVVIIAGLAVLVIVSTVCAQVTAKWFGAMTRSQRLDLVKLVKALRRGRK